MLREERKWNHIKCSIKRQKKVEDKSRKEQGQQIEKSTNMVDINPPISVITLNVSGLNAPIKRQRLSDWIKKQDPSICCHKKSTLNIKTHSG